MADPFRAWLLRCATRVRDGLDEAVVDPLLRLQPAYRLTAEESDTDGWYVALGGFRGVRGVRGEIQLWLDSFAGGSGRRCSAAFKVRNNEEAIRRIAQAGTGEVGRAAILRDDIWHYVSGGYAQMRQPLPKGHFRRPIAELYRKRPSWNFYSMYWPDDIKPGQPPRQPLVDEIVEFLGTAVRSVSGIQGALDPEPYPAVRNRAVVAQHLRRERPSHLADQAKIRDGFTCQICRISFVQLYGGLGRGFAEVHHRIPLAASHAPKFTRLEDLVTVCANCHRMLHRLQGKRTDVHALKKRFTGKWPRARPDP